MTEQLALTQYEDNGWHVVAVGGELDHLTGPSLKTALAELIAAGHTQIVVDLSAVPFLDSAGLGVLVGAHRRVRALGGTLRLAGCNPTVVRVLEITGLDKALPTYPDLADAIA